MCRPQPILRSQARPGHGSHGIGSAARQRLQPITRAVVPPTFDLRGSLPGPPTEQQEAEAAAVDARTETGSTTSVSADAHVCKTVTLPLCNSLQGAVEALREAIQDAQPQLQRHARGTFRFEASLPRGCSALRWLKGQSSSLVPHIYFSCRRSSAPSSPGILQAEAGRAGWSAVASTGAAWLWQGSPGSGFGA